MTKLLVAGRCDTGGLRVARRQIDDFVAERGYAAYLETSAKTRAGCAKLKQAIIDGIQWENIPWRSSPVLFKRLKDEIIRLKDEGRVLMRFNELREVLALRLTQARSASEGPDDAATDEESLARASGYGDEGNRFTDAELKAVIGLLAGPGVVWELAFGSWVLLRPELINTYAQGVIQTLRQDERELGSITEERVLSADLAFPKGLPLLPEDEERILLLAMHRLLVENGLCLREPTEIGALLVFPSYARRDRPDLVEHPSIQISYQFDGFLDDIYATLVVRLHHTGPFELDALWNGAADFKTMEGHKLGIKLDRKAAGTAELLVYFDPGLPVGEMMIFSKYVHEHLLRKAKDREDVVRLRHWVCKCGEPVENRAAAMRRLKDKGRKAKIMCVECEKRVPLWDDLEEAFADPKLLERVRQLEAKADDQLEAESRDRALVGDIVSTVALAGQTCREFKVSDHGLDMEIEFTDDSGEATGRKLYLILRSGDSALTTRKRDGAELFKIDKQQDARYWMKQACPVLLVVRNNEGHVRWMEIREHLNEVTNNGERQVRQIVFDGERFDVMSIRRWRDRILEPRPAGQSPLDIWREKLEFFLKEEAIVVNADRKFELTKRIEEAKEKIRELEG